jgi:hypothetical protein
MGHCPRPHRRPATRSAVTELLMKSLETSALQERSSAR